MIGPGIKRGTAELAVLSVLQDGPLHGYELARRIEQQTNGALRFTLAALYPMLYRMEQQRWIRGTWETSANGRRRRCYRLTPAGRKKLSPLEREWAELFRALQRLTKVAHACLAGNSRPATCSLGVACGRNGGSPRGAGGPFGRIRRGIVQGPEREAVHRTFEQVGDWEDLRQSVFTAKTGAGRMPRRTKQLWVPGFLTLILAMIFLAMFQKLGFQLRFIGSGPGAVLFYVPWLLSLPFFGTLGASLSSRSGGSRPTALLASVFPALALTAAFHLMLPIGMIVERATGHHHDFGVVATTLLRDGIGWLVVPGAALLAGGGLANILFGRRPSTQGTVVG